MLQFVWQAPIGSLGLVSFTVYSYPCDSARSFFKENQPLFVCFCMSGHIFVFSNQNIDLSGHMSFQKIKIICNPSLMKFLQGRSGADFHDETEETAFSMSKIDFIANDEVTILQSNRNATNDEKVQVDLVIETNTLTRTLYGKKY